MFWDFKCFLRNDLIVFSGTYIIIDNRERTLYAKRSIMMKIKTGLITLAMAAAAAFCFSGCSIGNFYSNADKYTSGDREITEEIKQIDVNWSSGTIFQGTTRTRSAFPSPARTSWRTQRKCIPGWTAKSCVFSTASRARALCSSPTTKGWR